MHGMGTRRAAVLLVAALAAGGAACGGGGEQAAVTPVEAADTTTPTTVDAAAAYMQCLRDKGVDLPERVRPADAAATPPSSRPAGARPSTSLPAGVDQATIASARTACQSLQPTDRGPMDGARAQAFDAYASCMKDHGVTIARGDAGGAGVNRDDPVFKAADAICGVLRS